jgi:hypothetical protein
LLFIEGGLFVGLASTLEAAESFIILFAFVLGFDCVWGLLASIGFAGSHSQRAEIKWAAINFVTALLVILLQSFLPVLLSNGLADRGIQVILLVIAIARTAIDYAWNHRFCCP